MTGPADYRGQDLGPYRRFRKTRFYGGCFTADTMYCNWVCDNCWSKFGWKGSDPTYELDSDEVVKRIVRGLRRHSFSQARISGGEPALLWQTHMRHVVEKFLRETTGEKIGGEDPWLVLETNGTVLTPHMIEKLEHAIPDEADRFQVTIGMKASSPERLASLTGHSPATARRFWNKQRELIEFLADPQGIVALNIVFLDAYCDEHEIDEIREWLAEIDPEAVDSIDMQSFKTAGWGSQKYTQRDYVPKRRRT